MKINPVNILNKSCYIGKQGMALYNKYCKDCKEFHYQWRYPCDNEKCEQGKVTVKPLGYSVCLKCMGREYL